MSKRNPTARRRAKKSSERKKQLRTSNQFSVSSSLLRLIAIFAGVSLAFSILLVVNQQNVDSKSSAKRQADIPDQLITTQVAQAASDARDYLLRQLLENGQFVYRINLSSKISLKPRYNILRHAGAIYSLGMIHDSRPDEETRAAIATAANFLRSQIAPLTENPELKAIWSYSKVNGRSLPDQAKLGGTGLGLVALLTEEKILPDSTSPETLRALGEFLLYMQQPSGGFYSKYIPSEGGFDDWVSLYYPGEAALGLAMLYEHDADSRWLASAKAAMEYLARIREGQEDVPHDHWALLATARILRHVEPNEDAELIDALINHAVQISTAILESQQRWLGDTVRAGAFDAEGRTTPCATRLEGLLAVLTFLPEEHNDLRTHIEQSCKAGLLFLMRAQIRSGNARGGFPRSIFGKPSYARLIVGKQDPRWQEIRIDYVQHALSALLQYESLTATELNPG